MLRLGFPSRNGVRRLPRQRLRSHIFRLDPSSLGTFRFAKGRFMSDHFGNEKEELFFQT